MPPLAGHHLPPFLIDVLRLCVWLLILSVIFVPLERLFALHPQKIFRKAIAVDLGYYFLNSLLIGLLLSIPLALVAWTAYRVVPWHVQTAVAASPLWLRILATLLVGEIGFYWGHRWTHQIPLLWQFHKVHHSAEQLDFIVNTRAHPVDMVFVRLCGMVPIYALGLASPVRAGGNLTPVLLMLVMTLWGFFIHANLRWRLGPLEWIVSTPGFHHWHHTLAAPTDRNFAPMMAWVDRLFGTFYAPKGEWPAAYGIKDQVAASFREQLLQPLLQKPPPRAI